MVLCAQLSDWRKFRISQGRDRGRYRNKLFSNLIDEHRELRQRYELGGDVRLVSDPKQQSRLENWMVFQNHHLKRPERFEKKRDELKKGLDDARRKVEVSECAAEDIEAVRQALEDVERDLKRHKVLLGWIEQKRRTMDPGYPTPVEENNHDRDTALNVVRRTSPRHRRTRRAEASAVLSKVKITKANSRGATRRSRSQRL